VGPLRCPTCGSLDDKVVDSRHADDGTSIRRRRECLGCARRFTTFERLEEVALVVAKRAGGREPFDRAKIVAGVRAAAKGRPVDDLAAEGVAVAIEDSLRLEGRAETSTEEIGRAVLDRLRDLDAVAAVRFASVYKSFDDPADFEREISLLTERPEPD
jgi:transcriptional repressor NrdR